MRFMKPSGKQRTCALSCQATAACSGWRQRENSDERSRRRQGKGASGRVCPPGGAAGTGTTATPTPPLPKSLSSVCAAPGLHKAESRGIAYIDGNLPWDIIISPASCLCFPITSFFFYIIYKIKCAIYSAVSAQTPRQPLYSHCSFFCRCYSDPLQVLVRNSTQL